VPKPITPKIPPDDETEQQPALNLGRKLTLFKGMNLAGLVVFGAPGIATLMSEDGGLLPVPETPPASERN
jgi:hypothetical protein